MWREPTEIGGDNPATETAAIVYERKIEIERGANPARTANLIDEIVAAVAMDACTWRQVDTIDVACVHPQIQCVGALRGAPAAPCAADEAIAGGVLLLRARCGRQE